MRLAFVMLAALEAESVHITQTAPPLLQGQIVTTRTLSVAIGPSPNGSNRRNLRPLQFRDRVPGVRQPAVLRARDRSRASRKASKNWRVNPAKRTSPAITSSDRRRL